MEATIKINEEYSHLVRPLSDEEYNALKSSIKERGLHVPIVVSQNREVLDGHHRYKICQELGIEPQFITKEFGDPGEEKLFVIECNLKRRQLSDIERIKLGTQLEPIERELARKRQLSSLKAGDRAPVRPPEAPSISNETNGDGQEQEPSSAGRVNEIVADKVGVSPTTYYRGKTVLEKGSEEVKEKVEAGEISINEGYSRTTGKKKKAPVLNKFKIKSERYEQAIKALQEAQEAGNNETEVWVEGKFIIGVGEVEITT